MEQNHERLRGGAMKSNKAGLKTYSVWAKATIDCAINIEANSLEDAVAKAKNLTDGDFFTVAGDYHDGSCKVYGVLEEDQR